MDHRDRVLFILACTGYGTAFVAERTIPIRGDLISGALVDDEPGKVRCWTKGQGGNARPDLDEEMGLREMRCVKVLDGVAPDSHEDGSRRYSVLMSLYAFTEQASELMPAEADLGEIARLIGDQIEGYVELFPVLAEAKVDHAIYRCAGATEQGASLAAAVREVLGADAVTLYGRPRTTMKDLHIVAATSPLESGNAHEVAGFVPTASKQEPQPMWAPRQRWQLLCRYLGRPS